ncbi:CocE/NonD family hydrolase, partial [Halomonas elongata]|uniref:CocE/NonD family hydrolase n=1 Tax=Halomonas elongata TaxID=2746 RepID=UPI00255A881C
MRVVDAFPRAVHEEETWIPMADGTRLAARIWRPVDAEQHPVPAILEYLPYRKRDLTAARDVQTHPYWAGHGYAGVRVDIRGTGESDGVLTDEYLPEELADGVAIIDWLVAQPWCSGEVGMVGISWGGFNGLQIAALGPPAL